MIESVTTDKLRAEYELAITAVLDIDRLDTQPFPAAVAERAMLYPSGPHLMRAEFDAIAEAALSVGDGRAFYLTLEGAAAGHPWSIDLTWSDYTAVAVEACENALISQRGQWAVAWMQDEVTIVGGSYAFVSRVLARLAVDRVVVADRYLSDRANDLSRFGFSMDDAQELVRHILHEDEFAAICGRRSGL
jgi:hypothetical protein